MGRRARKVFRIICYTLAAIVLLLGILLLLIRMPAVQTRIAREVTARLGKQLGTRIDIRAVAINFVDNASIQGIYLEDRQGDTLLYAGDLTVDLGFFKLLSGEIDIESVSLENGLVQVSQGPDSLFNFQFILDSFASTDTVAKEKSPAPKLRIGRVALSNMRASAALLSGKHQMQVHALEIKVNSLDLDSLQFDIASIGIDQLQLNSRVYAAAAPSKEIVMDQPNAAVSFPLADLPIRLKVGEIDIRESNILFQQGEAKAGKYFSPAFVNARNLHIEIDDLQVDRSGAQANIGQIACDLNERLQLRSLGARLRFSDRRVSIEDFRFESPASKGGMELGLEYSAFAKFLETPEAGSAYINLDSLQIALADVAYFVPTLDTMRLLQPFKNQVLHLQGELEGSLNSMAVSGLEAAISETRLEFDGDILGLSQPQKLYLRESSLALHSTIAELSKIIDLRKYQPQIRHFGHIDLESGLSGSLERLEISDLSLVTDGQLQARLSGTVQHLSEADRLRYDLQIQELSSGYQDARVFVDSLPQLVRELESLRYSGSLAGSKTHYILKGQIETRPGAIATDLDIQFNKDFSNARYAGKVSTRDFNLRQLLGNDSLGRVSMQAVVDGSGLSLEQIRSSLRLDVERFDFNSYAYHNLQVRGQVDRKQFEGQASIRDRNIAFAFNGLVNLNDSLPILDFKAELDTLNLYALHLSSYPLQMRWKLDAHMLGSTADNIEGKVRLSEIRLFNETQSWRTDSILFTAETGDARNRHLHLDAPFAQMDISGRYQVANLGKIVLNFADQYFPFSNMIGGKQPADVLPPGEEREISDDKIDFSLRIIDPTDIAQLFQVDLKKLDSARLQFSLDAPEKLLNFELYIPELEYGSLYFDSIYAFADNTADQLAANFSIDSIRLTETVSIPSLSLDALLSERRAVINTYIEGDSNTYSLGLRTLLNAPEGDIELSIDNPLYLNGQQWQVSQSKPYNLNGKEATLPLFTLSMAGQKLSISGDTSKLLLGFDNFDVNTLLSLVRIDSTQVQGTLNGDLQVGISGENAPIIGDLSLRSIAVNQMPVGNLELKAEKKGAEIRAFANLSGKETDIRSQADYNLHSKRIDGKVNIRALYLEPFGPFVKQYASGLTGYIRGDLDISGSSENPDLSGTLRFSEVRAKALATGTTYGIQSGSIRLSNGLIEPDINLIDQDKRTASLRGNIRHDYFQDMRFDLQFKAEHFTFLNSEKNSDALFYGKFIAAVDADIKGGIDLPRVRATVSTRPETDMTVQLISPEVVLNQESYMIFVDGVQNYSQRQLDSITQQRYTFHSGMDLLMNVNLSDDATIRVVTDPISGDNLEIKGNSQLVVKVPENGELSITGTYEVKEGNYRFSYQNLLKRDFALVKGSRLVFVGNPMDSRLDLKAEYKTLASTLPLVNNDLSTLSEAESNAMRKRAQVSILLSILGKLSAPELKFDIRIPEDNNGPVGNSVSQALERLRSNESDINREVFSILLFNSFSGSNSTGNISTAGSATAVRSIGNMINSQLNKLAGNVEGFQIDFGLNQYEDEVSEGGGSVTQVDLGASQSLFKDRVLISVGGNVDLESGNRDRQGLSAVTGDFVLEYKLTDSGRYRVKVFQKSDYDALNADNLWKTGVGFSYKSKFSKKKKKKQKSE